MEEAEALSTKLAIMDEGYIKCIGPVQTLKDKYGKGYEIEVKFKEANKNQLNKVRQRARCPGLDKTIDKKQVEYALTQIGKPMLLKKIAKGQEGSHIDTQVSYLLH